RPPPSVGPRALPPFPTRRSPDLTASGKSALAMAIARTRPVEIVSVDSAQVYRGLDIGTAKPSAADREAVPHHLIDIRDPAEPYRSEEHTSELQSRENLVCRLLLE